MASVIYTCAVIFFSPTGAILTVRKAKTQRFMLVGGKPEPDESPRQCALREAREEVGVNISQLELLGMWQAPAANEAGFAVHGTVFVSQTALVELPTPAAEIAETRWLEPSAQLPDNLAPLLATKILPALAAGGRWPRMPLATAPPWDGGRYRSIDLPRQRSQPLQITVGDNLPQQVRCGEILTVRDNKRIVGAVEIGSSCANYRVVTPHNGAIDS
ncbi:MAG: NUDIX domain-containing protein [Bowdeniella nasicola]|nr:NUDIX domain-containing protein [Bowdeniella nasicola]